MSPSNPITFLLSRLEEEIRKSPVETLPTILGELERVKARLWTRLLAPTAAKDGRPLPPGDRLLTPEEAALEMNTTVKWLYRHSKRLPFARKLSRKRLRFSEIGLRKWIEAKRTGPS